jgi:hypothetical protein
MKIVKKINFVMRTPTNNAIELLNNDKSIALVGPTGSGKTWFVLNELMLYLSMDGKKVEYFEDLNGSVLPKGDTDIVIIDEFETFVDREFLEKSHPNEVPYYSSEYVEQVNGWLDKASKIKQQLILVITRDEEDIDNFMGNVSVTDWGSPMVPLRFYREEG